METTAYLERTSLERNSLLPDAL